MIHVTERARQEFRRTLEAIADRPSEQRLRLARTASGQLGVFADAEQEKDQVVEHDGVPVLLISENVSEALDGRTIDVSDTGEGPRFVIRR